MASESKFCLETFILDYWEKTWIENPQFFDGIIDITLFDEVQGLDYRVDFSKVLGCHSPLNAAERKFMVVFQGSVMALNGVEMTTKIGICFMFQYR